MSWRHWGVAEVVLFGVAIAAGLAIGFVMGEQRGKIAGVFAGALIAVIRVSWPVRREPWFFATVVAFIAGDALAVVYVDWSFTKSWTGHVFGGFWLLDFVAMLAAVYGIYRLKYGVPLEVIENSPDDLPRYSERDIL